MKKPIDIDALVEEAVPMRENPQLAFTISLRVDSETNGREGWKAKWARKKKQKEAVAIAWLWAKAKPGFELSLPCAVRFTRVGPKRLDGDNLSESFKACRDQMAREIGVDDGDERIRWEYEQVAVGKRVYAVRVEIY